MYSESRRAFLSGRTRAAKPHGWEQFCSVLGQKTQGEKRLLADSQMYFAPKTPAEMHQARFLCAQHGVMMGVYDLPYQQSDDGLSMLCIDPKYLNRCQPLPSENHLWFVQPGCLLGDLFQAGLQGFGAWPAHKTFAAWLLDRHTQCWPTGFTYQSGVRHASLLMDDGSVASLGAFGQHATKPLNTSRLRQMVPQLFELQASPAAQRCLAQPTWSVRYRLDALQPAQPDGEVNLAQLLLGSGGDLGWVEWVVLDSRVLSTTQRIQHAQTSATQEQTLQVCATDIAMQVKHCFDPQGCFTYPGQEWDSMEEVG